MEVHIEPLIKLCSFDVQKNAKDGVGEHLVPANTICIHAQWYFLESHSLVMLMAVSGIHQ